MDMQTQDVFSVSFAKQVGDLIAGRRERLGVAQKILSQLCGFNPNALGKIERGEVQVGLENFLIIAWYLEMPVEDFEFLIRIIGNWLSSKAAQ